MNKICSLVRYAFLPVLLTFSFSSFAQSPKGREKIDQAFINLIEKQKLDNTASSKKCFLRKKNRKKTSSQNVAEKKYDCIVYTKNANVLRKKGIIINSELPAFVTASATLTQIMQMAEIPEVTYIAAPAIDRMHNQ